MSLKVQVWDHNLVGAAEFMGRVSVSLSSVADKRRHVAWHPLVDQRGVALPGGGAVELILWWKHNPELAAALVMDLSDAYEAKPPF